MSGNSRNSYRASEAEPWSTGTPLLSQPRTVSGPTPPIMPIMVRSKIFEKDATSPNKRRSFAVPDVDFKGPLKSSTRECTDVFCLVLFLTFLGFWAFVGAYAFANGDLQRILRPTNSRGEICGKGNMAHRPYLLYFDLTMCLGPSVLVTGCITPSVCVTNCPNTSFSYLQLSYKFTLSDDDKKQLICQDDVDLSQAITYDILMSYVAAQKCTSYYLESGEVNGRCIPGIAHNHTDGTINQTLVDTDALNLTTPSNAPSLPKAADIVNGSSWLMTLIKTELVLENVAKDYRASWWAITIGLIGAMILAFLWIIIMRYIASVAVWVAILGVIGLLSYGTYCCIDRYMAMKDAQTALGTSAQFRLTLDLTSYMAVPDTWLAFGIILALVLLILLLVVVSLRSRIQLAIALLEEGSRAVGDTLSTLFFPIFPFVMQCAILAWGIFTAMYLQSCGTVTGVVYNSTDNSTLGQRNNDTCDPNVFDDTAADAACQFKSYTTADELIYYKAFNLLGLCWSIFFVLALGEMTLSGAFASWYWTWDKVHDLPTLPLAKSFRRACRFHLGSIAFGSLIIAIIRVIRYVISSADKKLRKFDNPPVRYLLKCCACCCWCLERFLRYINRNAYILIAIYGKNFCDSAREAFNLLTRNILRVAALDNVTAFLLFMGKLVVVGIMGVAAYFFFASGTATTGLVLNYIWVPTATIVIGSYVIASAFFSVYEMAIDTLFICFLEDVERNDGSDQKPYFMPRRLMLLLGKHNAKIRPGEKSSKPDLAPVLSKHRVTLR